MDGLTPRHGTKHNPRGHGPPAWPNPRRSPSCCHLSPRALRTSTLWLVGALLARAPFAPQEKRPLRIDDLFALRDVGEPRLSPDGAQVAFTVRSLDPKKDKSDTDIYLIPVAGGRRRPPHREPQGRDQAALQPRRQVPGLPLRPRRQEDPGLPPSPRRRRGPEAHRLQGRRLRLRLVARLRRAWPCVVVRPRPRRDRRGQGGGDEDEEDAKKTPKPIVMRRLQFKRDVRRLPPRAPDAPPRVRRQVEDGLPGDRAGPTTTRSPAWSPDGQSHRLRQQPDGRSRRQPEHRHLPGGARGRAPSRGQITTAPTEASDAHLQPRRQARSPTWKAAIPPTCATRSIHLSVVPAAGGDSRPLTKNLDRNRLRRPRFSADGRAALFLLEDRRQHPSRPDAGGGRRDRAVGRAASGCVSAFDAGAEGRARGAGEPARPSGRSSRWSTPPGSAA